MVVAGAKICQPSVSTRNPHRHIAFLPHDAARSRTAATSRAYRPGDMAV